MNLVTTIFRLRWRSLAGSAAQVAGLAISLAVLALSGRAWLKAAESVLASLAGAAYERELTAILWTVLFVWMVAGGAGNLHLGWNCSLTTLLRLPVRPRRIFLAKSLCALAGPWLLLILPMLAWLAWEAAPGARALALIPAILLFALAANSLTNMAAMFLGRRVKNRIRIGLAGAGFLALSLAVLGSIRAAARHRTDGLEAAVRRLATFDPGWVRYLPPAGPLATIYRSLREHSPGAAAGAFALLILSCVALLAAEYFLVRRMYLGSGADGSPRAAKSSMLLRGMETALRMQPAARPWAVALVRELGRMSQTPSSLVMMLLFVCYCPVSVVFLPPANVIQLALILLPPFMAMGGLKGNMLGPDAASARLMFSQPGGLLGVVNVRSAALNLQAGIVVLAALTAALITGTPRMTAPEAGLFAAWLVTVFQVWNLLGAWCSLAFPQPIQQKASEPVRNGSSAGPLTMIYGIPLVLAPFAWLYMAGIRTGHPYASLFCAWLLPVFLAGAGRYIFRPWLRELAFSRREKIYFALARPAAV